MRSSPLRLLGNEEQPLHELPVRQPQAGFTKSAANILETLLGAFDKRPPRLFSQIDSGGVQTAIDVSSSLSKQPKNGKQVVFRTVFGATEEMPIAALSYLLPAIRIAEKLKVIEVNRSGELPLKVSAPRVEFLFMNEAGTRLNKLDRKEVEKQNDLFTHAAKSYIHRFHPTIESDIAFSDDKDITPALLRSPIFKLAELVIAFVAGSRKKQLGNMAKRHSNGRGFRTYAALHPFVHEVVDANSDTSALVSFGADSERVFYSLRRLLRPILKLDKQRRILPTIQYITNHSTPPYHMMAGGDTSLSTVLQNPAVMLEENPDVHSPVRKALDQLQSDAGGKRELFDFFKSQERR